MFNVRFNKAQLRQANIETKADRDKYNEINKMIAKINLFQLKNRVKDPKLEKQKSELIKQKDKLKQTIDNKLSKLL